MPTDTFSISSAANDGTGLCVTGGVYPPNTTSDFIAEDDDGSNELFITKFDNGSDRGFEMAMLRWDTSSIDDAATITGANLKIYVVSKTDGANDKKLIGDYYDFGGEPTVGADMTETIASSIFTQVDLGVITTSAVNTIALTDLSGINKSGFTGIRLGLSSGTPTVVNVVTIAAFEHAQQEAQLEVTYSAASVTNEATLRQGRSPLIWRT